MAKEQNYWADWLGRDWKDCVRCLWEKFCESMSEGTKLVLSSILIFAVICIPVWYALALLVMVSGR